MALDERAFFTEKPETRPGSYQCPKCRRTNEYAVRWVRRSKKDRLPPGADERDRARFAKLRDYLLRLDDEVTCKTCHGATGGGDGPIAAPNGPIAGVLPIGPGPMGFSLATGLTDGHIYTTISIGRGRMPSYRRIAPSDRWDVVNYIRDLNGQLGGGQ